MDKIEHQKTEDSGSERNLWTKLKPKKIKDSGLNLKNAWDKIPKIAALDKLP